MPKTKRWKKILVIVSLIIISLSMWIVSDFGSGLGFFSMLLGFIPLILAFVIGYVVETDD